MPSSPIIDPPDGRLVRALEQLDGGPQRLAVGVLRTHDEEQGVHVARDGQGVADLAERRAVDDHVVGELGGLLEDLADPSVEPVERSQLSWDSLPAREHVQVGRAG